MSEITRIWKVSRETDSLKEIKRQKLNLEDRIESWIAHDISIISDDFLVIGRQQATSYGGYIDLLGIDQLGDLVLLELKRDKTPREITAQALDYASWVKDLSNEEITENANEYLKDDGPLEEAFSRKFDEPLPEILNESHKIIVVGSQIDSHSERIIRYLSETYGVNINAVTFDFYEDEGQEYLARNFLLEPENVAASQSKKSRGKRKPPLSIDEFIEYAEKNGFKELFVQALDAMSEVFDSRSPTQTTISFIGIMEGRRNTILNLEPFKSNNDDGVSFYFYLERFCSHFNVKSEELQDIFDTELTQDTKWNVNNVVYRGFIKSSNQIQNIVKRLEK